MYCNKCGTQNPDGATFCKNCGNRLDGKVICPACGKELPADSKFCVYCGKVLGGVEGGRSATPAAYTPAPNYTQNYTPNYAPAGYVPAGYVPARRPSVNLSVVMGYVSEGLAMFSALIAFIFMFLIGCVVGSGSGSSDEEASANFFYFFSDAYKDVKAFEEAASTEAGDLMRSGAIFGTIATALIIIAVAIPFIIGVIKYVMRLCGKNPKSIYKLAATTFFAYIAGVALYLICIGGKANLGTVEMNYTLNGATIAGLVLGCVFFAASMVTAIVAERGNLTLSVIKGYVVSVVAAVLLVVALCLPAFGIVSFGMSSDGENLNARFGIFNMFAFLGTLTAAGNSITDFNELKIGETIVSVLFFICVVAFLAVAMLALAGLFTNTKGKNDRTSFALLILSGVLSIISGIFQILANMLMFSFLDKNILDLSINIYSNNAVPITLIVFGVLVIVAAIIYSVITAKNTATAPVPASAAAETAADSAENTDYKTE